MFCYQVKCLQDLCKLYDSYYCLIMKFIYLLNSKWVIFAFKFIIFQTAIVFASQNGLKVTVEDAKCVQANAFIQAGLFQEFTIREEQVTFKLNLTVLLVRSCFNASVWQQKVSIQYRSLDMEEIGHYSEQCLVISQCQSVISTVFVPSLFFV